MYELERIPVADLPPCPEHDPDGIVAAVELRAAGSEPPPIVVVRSFIVHNRRRTAEYAIYDGLRRVTAAKRLAVDTIEAAVCNTTAAAEGLRARIQLAGGAVKFWQAEKPQALPLKPQA